MKDFHIGDRVKIYGTITCEIGGPGHYTYKRGEPGIVTNVIENDEILVRTKWGESSIHPKQCRRLKPKKRREWWVIKESSWTDSFDGKFVRTKPPTDHPELWVHVREVINAQKGLKT